MRNKAIVAFVSRLLCVCCPAYISRLVVAIVIRKAIKRMSTGRSLANIREEIRKRSKPSLTHCYAATAVSLIGMVGLVVAAITNAEVDSVFGTNSTGWASAVTEAAANCGLPKQASTATGEAPRKCSSGNNFRVPAFAKASPLRMFASESSVGGDGQSSVLLAGAIFELRTIGDRMSFSHDVRFLIKRVLWLEPSSVQPLVRLVSLYRTKDCLSIDTCVVSRVLVNSTSTKVQAA